MWKLTAHKRCKNKQEIKVRALLTEMVEYSYATYAGAFEQHFKKLVAEIPKTNNYSAELLFKVTQRNLKSVEVWKLTAAGDYKYKMFTLDYV
jgi:hypothetical protein